MPRKKLVGGGFGGRMHAVLRHFVDAARRRFLVETEELVQGAGSFADLVGLFDRLGDISLGENHRFAQLLSAGELRGDG